MMTKKRFVFASLLFVGMFLILINNVSALDWPMFMNNLNHTGYQNETLNAANFVNIWKYPINSGSSGSAVLSSPAVSSGIVYVGSYDSSYGRFYALNATTGSQIWNYTTGYFIDSSPAVSSGIVYIGGESNRIYAFNGTNGSLVWNYTAGGQVESSPAVYNGAVYIGSDDKNVYALNATTGTKIWNYTTGGWVFSSPALLNGVLYVGSENNYVYALNATTGSQIWNHSTTGFIESSPAVYNGVVYIGSTDNYVYALNATTGSQIWNFLGNTSGSFISSPAVYNGVVYIGNEDNNTYALNATNGNKIWNYSTGGAILSSPAISNGIVFIGSDSNYIYALNATTGNQIWTYSLKSGVSGSIESSPAISNGIVFIGSDDGNLYAFHSSTAQCNSCGSCSSVLQNALPGDTVQLTASISDSSNGTCIDFMGNDNVTFDCQSYSNFIQGPNNTNTTDYGIYFNSSNGGSNHDTVKNCNISDFAFGVYLDSGSNNNYLTGVITSSNSQYGIEVSLSSNNTLQNIISNLNTYYGIDLYLSSNNILSNITSYSNQVGIHTSSASNNTIKNVTAYLNSGDGVYIDGSGNLLTNITTTLNSGNGVFLDSSKSNLTNINASSNYKGIDCNACSGNIINNSHISNNSYIGLEIESFQLAVNNTFYNNVFNNTVNYYNSSSSISYTNYFNTTLTAGTNILGGSYIGGNYWGNWSALGTGFSDTCTNSGNGICNTAYLLPDGVSYDYLPLSINQTLNSSSSSGSGGVTPPSGTSTGSSNGTSAVAANTTTSTRRITTTSGTFTNITAGTQVTYYPNSTGIGITSLTITTNQTVYNATINLSAITTVRTSDLSIKASGRTYQSFQIKTTNINDSVISNVTMTFQINKSWITANRLNASNVFLYRNTNTPPARPNWGALPTNLTGNDSQYYYYTAVSPGFSDYTVFAVSLSEYTPSVIQNFWLGFGDFLNNLSNFKGYVLYYILVFVVLIGIVIVVHMFSRNLAKRHEQRIWKNINNKK